MSMFITFKKSYNVNAMTQFSMTRSMAIKLIQCLLCGTRIRGTEDGAQSTILAVKI